MGLPWPSWIVVAERVCEFVEDGNHGGSASEPSAPRLSLPRTSTEVSLGTRLISSASCLPSSDVR